MVESILNFLNTTGIAKLLENNTAEIIKTLIMYVIIGALFYLAVVKKFEPLLLLPIAFGMLLANLPGANVFHMDFFFDEYYFNTYGAEEFEKMLVDGHIPISTMIKEVFNRGGLVDILYIGVKSGLYPSLIFMGVGAMTDFTALIANPKSLLIGAAAQLGVFVAFAGALLMGFNPLEAASIGIIGGADGPTAILVTKTLAPALLGAIAIAAYSYMALIPIIQPPFMKMLTTKKEREIVMKELRPVSQIEKVIFPILVTLVVTFIVPDAAPLIGFLMLGNLFNVCGVTDRLSKTAQNELCNIVTIFLGVSVGATANASNFLSFNTIKIIVLGLTAFAISTCGGLLFAKLMNFLTGGKINPLIGSAGVSAVPMAARVSQVQGQKANPVNFLLMHAMGPNVAGVIGSAVAAGVFLSTYSGVTLL